MNAVTTHEPSTLVALAKGTAIMAVITAVTLGLIYGIGYLCVTHGLESKILQHVYNGTDFSTASLTDTEKYFYVGAVFIMDFSELVIILIPLIAFTVCFLIELGGKEIFPRW
ncbi:hypothetical protein [Xanthomonas albilineans]|uniref:hypothetical protein n=1 Tax=Xanthomonas albilineans TaxID=29447 RepID=UPI001E391A09|nr:hypothetical protein [Xanthomonas albilineans]